MKLILASIAVFLVIILLLVVILLVAKKYLLPSGNVKVTINGQFQVQRVELDPIAVDPRDVPMLQDLIVAASKDAHARMLELTRDRLGPMLGGLNLPGMGL